MPYVYGRESASTTEINHCTHEQYLHPHEFLSHEGESSDAYKMALNILVYKIIIVPQDRRSIHRCLRHVGQNHPISVQALVSQLLAVHPYFDGVEPSVQDGEYICKVWLGGMAGGIVLGAPRRKWKSVIYFFSFFLLLLLSLFIYVFTSFLSQYFLLSFLFSYPYFIFLCSVALLHYTTYFIFLA